MKNWNKLIISCTFEKLLKKNGNKSLKLGQYHDFSKLTLHSMHYMYSQDKMLQKSPHNSKWRNFGYLRGKINNYIDFPPLITLQLSYLK